ncbi:hypothetical protein [Nonomuraea soli]|uniref:Uncharacterized protein n=1 Tax=Nonomuraea soli TaxID=1032476 RepID=A0A7W0CIL5_9ACTN|nr:hypothetical protein [Nonomuraea soli]MBA2891897.1 hypothetical protein [Nonomuraea soli]
MILVAILLLASVLAVMMWRRRNRVTVRVEIPLFMPVEIQAEAHDLIEAGEFDQAVILIRKAGQVSRFEAWQTASALRDGFVGSDFPARWPEDLAEPVGRFLDEGRRKAAVFLVRVEKGMDAERAEQFVSAIESAR